MIIKCEAETVYNTLKNAIAPHICGSFDIKRTPNGKPYIEGNPVYFSLSHSGEKAVIAISDSPVGIDCELIGRRTANSVISRFTERERAEINGDIAAFLYNWTAKEAFIKMLGGTLARDLKRLEYFGGKLYLDAIPQDCAVEHMNDGELIITVCTKIPAR